MNSKTLIGTLALAAMAFGLASTPAFAQMKDTMAMECTDANVMKSNEMAMKVTDNSKKQMATKEVAMAKEAMAKKDSKGCMMHLENAAKAMK